MPCLIWQMNMSRQLIRIREPRHLVKRRESGCYLTHAVRNDGMRLMTGEDMGFLKVRNGCVEFLNMLFMTRTLNQVVQTRVARQDKSMEDQSKVRGVEVTLRTLQFKAINNIEEKLAEWSREGLIWGKYGLWKSSKLSEEENLQRGEWLIFGAWPESLRCTSLFRFNS